VQKILLRRATILARSALAAIFRLQGGRFTTPAPRTRLFAAFKPRGMAVLSLEPANQFFDFVADGALHAATSSAPTMRLAAWSAFRARRRSWTASMMRRASSHRLATHGAGL